MKKNEIDRFKDKRILIVLKVTGFKYEGYIKELLEESFLFLDKYKNELLIDYSQVGVVTLK